MSTSQPSLAAAPFKDKTAPWTSKWVILTVISKEQSTVPVSVLPHVFCGVINISPFTPPALVDGWPHVRLSTAFSRLTSLSGKERPDRNAAARHPAPSQQNPTRNAD